jgi:hypothetical protein
VATAGLPIESLQGIKQTAEIPIEWWAPVARILIATGAKAAALGIGTWDEPYHPEHRHDLIADSTGFLVVTLAVCASIRARGPARD